MNITAVVHVNVGHSCYNILLRAPMRMRRTPSMTKVRHFLVQKVQSTLHQMPSLFLDCVAATLLQQHCCTRFNVVPLRRLARRLKIRPETHSLDYLIVFRIKTLVPVNSIKAYVVQRKDKPSNNAQGVCGATNVVQCYGTAANQQRHQGCQP